MLKLLNLFCFLLILAQETHERFPKLGQIEAWDELGSGETEEGGSADCDDEDGCQASGDGQSQNCKYLYTRAVALFKRTLHYVVRTIISDDLQ